MTGPPCRTDHAGGDVEVAIAYASDDIIQFPGVFVDDIEVSTGMGSTSLELDGDQMDGWSVPGAPDGSPPNPNDWTFGTAEDAPPTTGEIAGASLGRQPEIIDFLSFGDTISGDSVVVHELAHQCYGDSLALHAWQDIWLNEGFASYAEWLWSEREGLGTAGEAVEFWTGIPADDPSWALTIGDPGPDALFALPVYQRGAMTLHAQRLEVGDTHFFRILRRGHSRRAGGNVTTDQFIGLAERVSGQRLDDLFDTWLYTSTKPAALDPPPGVAVAPEPATVPGSGPATFGPSENARHAPYAAPGHAAVARTITATARRPPRPWERVGTSPTAVVGPGRRGKVRRPRGAAAQDPGLAHVLSGVADVSRCLAAPPQVPTPGSAWWGGGAGELQLAVGVGEAEFVELFDKARRPDGSGTLLGRAFRKPQGTEALAIAAAAGKDSPHRRWMAAHEVKRKGPRASVAAWDCTLSPVKSVSILWAAGDLEVQEAVWAAHSAAVDAGLAYLEEHAAFVRAGRNGVRVLDTSGLVVSRFNEWTSRAGDMQIHTHCLLLNRARTSDDGKWRALDGRAVLAAKAGAGALYNRVLEAELTRRLGVAWRDRPDGLREIAGVDDDLIELFSTRRRAITARIGDLIAGYEAKYGAAPSPAVQWRMAQHITLATRPSKKPLTAADALARWETTATANNRRLTGLATAVTHRALPASKVVAADPEELLARLADSPRTTFSPHDLLRAALDIIPPANLSADSLRRRAEQLARMAQASPQLLQLSAPDVIDVPPRLQRSDGSSVYNRPSRSRWALTDTIDQEAWLLQQASERGAHTIDAGDVDTSTATHGLGRDQHAAIAQILCDDRRVQQLVGPAGAGKTRALRAAVDAWQAHHGPVLGLTVSQAAANVLATEAHVQAENTAKWLHETSAGRWTMKPGSLVLVDEASMVSTAQLVAIVDQARRTSSKVVLIGDPAQLAAIHPGGGFDLLVDRHGAARLREVRRFTADWAAAASLQLRRRDPACLAEYSMRGRIHSGTSNDVEDALFEAWQADATTVDENGDRRSVLMVVTSNEQAAVMAERARTLLVDAGVVDASGPAVTLRDNDACVGDHIVTRRNRRSLQTSDGGWVVNGDVWTILDVHRNGSATARRHGDDATVTLPASYLAEHAHLGYATTAHRSQGMTVDVCHALTTVGDSHQQLYVAATRGRDANHIYVATDSDHDRIHHDKDVPTAERILSGILRRRDPDRLSAHQTVEDSQHDVSSLARLGAIHEDACRRATNHWAAATLDTLGIDATGDPQWPSLVAKLRELALAGHDQHRLLTSVSAGLGDDVHRAAAVLHWRLTHEPSVPVSPRGLTAAIPPIDTADTRMAKQTVALMRHRWHAIRHHLADGDTPDWVDDLGPRPQDPQMENSWLTAATAAAAYRERYDLPNHVALIGPRPTPSRPDARAAYDHAQLQIDRQLLHRLTHLDDTQLERLASRQQQVIHAEPAFDPQLLEQAHRTRDDLDRARRTEPDLARGADLDTLLAAAHRDVVRLERLAGEHQRWRHREAAARNTLRQIDLLRSTNRTHPRDRTRHASTR